MLFRRLLLAVALALAVTAPASARTLDTSGYLEVADRLQAQLDPLWSSEGGRYRPGSGGTETMTNANLLLTHSVAALEGHDGPSRADGRARRIAEFLLEGRVWVERVPPRGGTHGHAPAWVSSTGSSGQHLVVDAEVVDALVHAYRARRRLELSDRVVELIRDRIRRLAQGSYWRYPTLRLNQINWYALVYAADAEVNGNTRTLATALRGNLRRFVGGAAPRAGAAGNFGAGLRFHYLPARPLNAPHNVDSAEYANIVLSFARFYDQARRAGMPAPDVRDRRFLQQWVRRALTGYWTHAGYLNWDSGLGFERWHQAKKLGLTQHALIGIASAAALQPSPAYGRYAKELLDRGLLWYAARSERGLPAPVFFGVSVVPQGDGSARLAASRIQANAARAAAAGLGRLAGGAPPAMYAYDPDIGRLAVSTPAYNTAIVAVNQGAFPYGGIELARLFDGDQDVAANIGGRAPAAFGLLARDTAGRRLLASQTGRAAMSRSVTPLRLTRAPAGAGATAAASVGRAFAGTFTDLRAAGSLRAGALTAITRHRFTARAIETDWRLDRRGGPRTTVDVLFPSWGANAKVVAVLRDGREVPVTGNRRPLSQIDSFVIRSAGASYTVTPLRRPGGAAAHLLRTARQSSAPNPGPTLAIQLARKSTGKRFRFAARIAVG